MICEATIADAGALAGIYNYYIQNTVITFEEDAITASDMLHRIEKVRDAGYPWLVAREQGRLIGYAYAAKWHERAAYKHTAEITVYLDHEATSRGWGSRLYEALFAALRETSVHVAIGGIALPNRASVALHEKFGMKKVAHFEAVGCKFGNWIDVGYWQVCLEMR